MKIYEGVETVAREIPDILHDESRFESGIPAMVCFPENSDDLRTALSGAVSRGQKVTLIGALTGTTGGAVPEAGVCAISFSAMNRIRSFEQEAGRPVLVCDPGVSLDVIDKFLRNPGAWPYTVPGAETLLPGGFFYPPDPTEMTAQLGGTIATNASGARSYRFGPTRPHIAWLDLVFANGEAATAGHLPPDANSWDRKIVTDSGRVIDIPALPYTARDIKNAAGFYSSPTMGPIDLFIGSEGTLAAISRIGIYLQPTMQILSGLTFFNSLDAAFDFADFLRGEPDMAAIELFDNGSLRFIDKYRDRMPDHFPEFPKGAHAAVLWEVIERQSGDFEGSMDRWEAALVKCGSSLENTWSGFDEAEKERLHHFRHALPETVNSIIAENKRSCKEIRKIGTDSAFPAAVFREAYAEMMMMIEQSGLTFAAFGHLGNYHIHINLIPTNAEELATALKLYDALMALALRYNGTVSAEHGIGKIKKKYLKAMYGEAGVDGMRAIKLALDPQGVLNPGNLF